MFGSIKISILDKLTSLIVRKRDGYKCVRCGREHDPTENTSDASHYWGRGNKSVRYDFENIDTLCKFPCHSSKDPKSLGWEYCKQIKGRGDAEFDGAYTRFKKKQLGEDRFNLLMVRAHTPTKIDEPSLKMGLKLLLKRLETDEKRKIIGGR